MAATPSLSPFPSTRPLLLHHHPKPSLPAPHSSPTPPPSLSLAEQLGPFSQTLLGDSSSSHPSSSTWINPSKPRPSPHSLQRRRRPPFPLRGPGSRFARLCRAVADLPDNLDAASFASALSEIFPYSFDRETALPILASLISWRKSLSFLRWLQSLGGFQVDTVFYNIVLRSLCKGRQYNVAEELAQEMVTQGIEMNNITYATVITCAKQHQDYDCAIGWFERLYKTGLVPDEVTFSAALDAYALSGRVQEVLTLFEKEGASGWTSDPVAFEVLGKIFGETGNSDDIQNMLEEMKKLGVKTNLILYNTLIQAAGKAKKPGLARGLFENMLASGLEPNERTLTELCKIYGNLRCHRNGLNLWEHIMVKRWPMNLFLCNALLKMLAELHMSEKAEELFAEMKQSKHNKPNSRSYTTMLFAYSRDKKVEKVVELFAEMLNRGMEPDAWTYVSVIQCFGNAGRMDDAVGFFDLLINKGIKLNDPQSGCLLSLLVLCEKGEMGKILGCLEKVKPKMVRFIQMLGDEEVKLGTVKKTFQEILAETALESRQPFCNFLIDICINQNFPAQMARELFQLAVIHDMYPHLHTKKLNSWSLDVRSLSFGVAFMAFEEWMRTLAGHLKTDDAVTQFFVYSGTVASKGLASAFASHLAELGAPFHPVAKKAGCFMANREDLVQWVQDRASTLAAST